MDQSTPTDERKGAWWEKWFVIAVVVGVSLFMINLELNGKGIDHFWQMAAGFFVVGFICFGAVAFVMFIISRFIR